MHTYTKNKRFSNIKSMDLCDCGSHFVVYLYNKTCVRCTCGCACATMSALNSAGRKPPTNNSTAKPLVRKRRGRGDGGEVIIAKKNTKKHQVEFN